ncbi:MAG: YHS domain-containing (seleno)protein [Bacteroidota bacterium]
MKRFTFLAALNFVFFISYGQQIDYNQNDGYVAEGYDVVSYFNKKAVAGKKQYEYTYDGAKYRFTNQDNLNKFKSNPTMYVPQYGGWCAYAMGTSGDKVTVNPKTYEIRNGKLYLFYNAFFNNTLESWLEEGPNKLKPIADKNWEKVKTKK